MLYSDTKKINDFAVIESALVTSLITDDWLVGFHHISKQLELYNLKSDPMCHYNVANVDENKRVIEVLQITLVNWRREQNPELSIGDNPLYWDIEILGDKESTTKLWNSYLKGYEYLTTIDGNRPGIVGDYAKEVLKKINN